MTHVISVCGPSCCGKTRCVNAIKNSLPPENVVVISQDSYYFTGNEETNYDVPEAIDFQLLIAHIKDLIAGKSIQCPIYDFATHSRLEKTIEVKSSKIIIVEGILIFTQKELLNLFDLKIYISAYPELAFSRRLKRDVEERGRTIEEITERYFKDVLPSTKRYVEPSEDFSDIVLKNNTKDKFIGLQILLNHIKTL
jgi:uridine kinase